MIVTVFGASGNVGRQVVARLLERGDTVRAFVHSHVPFEPAAKLEITKGDVHDTIAVARAVQGADVVISTVSSWGTPDKDVLSSTMRNVIAAAPKRVISLTGSGVLDTTDHPGALDRLNRALIRTVAHRVFQDGEQHLALLHASSLDWTVLRSPVMRGGRGGNYSLDLTLPAPWAIVARADVAAALVELTTSPAWSQRAPFIH